MPYPVAADACERVADMLEQTYRHHELTATEPLTVVLEELRDEARFIRFHSDDVDIKAWIWIRIADVLDFARALAESEGYAPENGITQHPIIQNSLLLLLEVL